MEKENRLNFIGGRDVRTIIKLIPPLAFGFHLLYNQRHPDLVHMSGKQCNRTTFLRCVAPILKKCSKSRIPIPIEIHAYLSSG